ncbi:hypothetical protein MSG28_004655 [Choristoneura fumiferana]|uniref:Uncharacterized protein n=1 Tax=Choristoneura fumiferana TaxID=7141 RepID=A0ACC0K6W4_CHOFU|nr:hypothetical protein MSG28_004655 [Choristoneura fumiferana]
MHLLGDIECEKCYKPVGRRLGLFEARDDYECYTERYVKCFWGLCDRRHSSHASILSKSDGKGS